MRFSHTRAAQPSVSPLRREKRRRIRRALLNEARRRAWVDFHLLSGDFASAAALGWKPLHREAVVSAQATSLR